MPYVISCLTCHNPLTVSESPAAYVVACPTCHNLLTVPAVATLVGPQPFDASAAPAPRQFRPARDKRGPTRIALALLSIAGLIGAAVYLFVADGRFMADSRAAKGKQSQDAVDTLLAIQKSILVDREMQFWIDKGVSSDEVAPLAQEATELHTVAKRVGSEFDTKWGAERKGLASLDPEMFERWELFKQKTERGVDIRLQGGFKILALDEEQLRLRIAVEVPVRRIDRPAFDRATAEGERKFQEFERLLPSLEKVAKAECELERVKRFNPECSALVKKFIAKARQENKRMIAELERELLPRVR